MKRIFILLTLVIGIVALSCAQTNQRFGSVSFPNTDGTKIRWYGFTSDSVRTGFSTTGAHRWLYTEQRARTPYDGLDVMYFSVISPDADSVLSSIGLTDQGQFVVSSQNRQIFNVSADITRSYTGMGLKSSASILLSPRLSFSTIGTDSAYLQYAVLAPGGAGTLYSSAPIGLPYSSADNITGALFRSTTGDTLWYQTSSTKKGIVLGGGSAGQSLVWDGTVWKPQTVQGGGGGDSSGMIKFVGEFVADNNYINSTINVDTLLFYTNDFRVVTGTNGKAYIQQGLNPSYDSATVSGTVKMVDAYQVGSNGHILKLQADTTSRLNGSSDPTQMTIPHDNGVLQYSRTRPASSYGLAYAISGYPGRLDFTGVGSGTGYFLQSGNGVAAPSFVNLYGQSPTWTGSHIFQAPLTLGVPGDAPATEGALRFYNYEDGYLTTLKALTSDEDRTLYLPPVTGNDTIANRAWVREIAQPANHSHDLLYPRLDGTNIFTGLGNTFQNQVSLGYGGPGILGIRSNLGAQFAYLTATGLTVGQTPVFSLPNLTTGTYNLMTTNGGQTISSGTWQGSRIDTQYISQNISRVGHTHTDLVGNTYGGVTTLGTGDSISFIVRQATGTVIDTSFTCVASWEGSAPGEDWLITQVRAGGVVSIRSPVGQLGSRRISWIVTKKTYY